MVTSLIKTNKEITLIIKEIGVEMQEIKKDLMIEGKLRINMVGIKKEIKDE